MRTLTLLGAALFFLTALNSVAASTDEEMLQLVRKDPRSWRRIDSEGSAQLCFSRQLGNFTCSGQNLESARRYALIQHDDTSPRGEGYIVALGTTSSKGDIRLTGNWKHWHGKVWLVIADDVRGNAGDEKIDKLIHWQPTRYLFENKSLL